MRLNWVNAALLGCVLSSPVWAQTGTPKTADELNQEIATTLASGQNPTITALQLRQVLVDMVASILDRSSGAVLIGELGAQVNGILISGATAGNPSSIVSGGTDANVNILYNTQGTGSHLFRSQTNTAAALAVQTSDGATSVLNVDTASRVVETSGDFQALGHFRQATIAPALTSCGTSPTIVGDDKAGLVTMGTGAPTGCVITFHTAYAAAPSCTVSWQATPLASQSYTVSTVAISLIQTATSSNLVNYSCMAQSGG